MNKRHKIVCKVGLSAMESPFFCPSRCSPICCLDMLKKGFGSAEKEKRPCSPHFGLEGDWAIVKTRLRMLGGALLLESFLRVPSRVYQTLLEETSYFGKAKAC